MGWDGCEEEWRVGTRRMAYIHWNEYALLIIVGNLWREAAAVET